MTIKNQDLYIYKTKIENEKFDTGHTVAIKSALNFMPQKSINDFLDVSNKITYKIENIEKYKNYTEEELFEHLQTKIDEKLLNDKRNVNYL